MNTKKFVHQDIDGKPWGIVNLEQLWANVYAFKYNRPVAKLPQAVWQDLFDQAKSAAIEFGAETVWIRLRKEYEIEMFQNILTSLGMKKISERVEYQSDVELLPDDSGTPLRWKTAKELEWSKEKIAQFTGEIIKGDLDIEPDEKPENFIQDWLQHDEFAQGYHTWELFPKSVVRVWKMGA